MGLPLYYVEYLVRIAFLFVLGTVLGSMLNVCIYRLPLHDSFWPAIRNLFYPPSRCPNCFNFVRFYDNIPIIGWIKLRGRCRFCGTKFSVRYPLIELLTGLLFVAFYWLEIPPDWIADVKASSLFHNFGPQLMPDSWLSATAWLNWRFAFHATLVLLLIVASFIDFDLKIIPDTVTLPGMAIGVIGNCVLGQVYVVPVWFRSSWGMSYREMYRLLFENSLPQSNLPLWLANLLDFTGVPAWIPAHPHLHGLLVGLAGLVVGGGVIWAVRAVGYLMLRREAMGFGDVTLMAMIGSFIGWQPVLVVFFIAPLCALVVAVISWLLWRHREIPYGPYLSLATIVVLLDWRRLWPPIEERVFVLGPFLPVAAGVMLVTLAGLLLISRLIQQWLGIYPDLEEPAEWTSGDQLAFFAGNKSELPSPQHPASPWPGTLAGTGLAQQQNWRKSSAVQTGQDWKSHWQRRP